MNNGWIPISALAKEYNKSHMTMLRWINSSFIFSLGYSVWRDVSGRYYVKPSSQSQQSPPTL